MSASAQVFLMASGQAPYPDRVVAGAGRRSLPRRFIGHRKLGCACQREEYVFEVGLFCCDIADFDFG